MTWIFVGINVLVYFMMRPTWHIGLIGLCARASARRSPAGCSRAAAASISAASALVRQAAHVAPQAPLSRPEGGRDARADKRWLN